MLSKFKVICPPNQREDIFCLEWILSGLRVCTLSDPVGGFLPNLHRYMVGSTELLIRFW